MNCKEICSKYVISTINLQSSGRYDQGKKRCTSCSVYIDYKGTKCPCCGSTLRTKPRNSARRKAFSNQRIFKELKSQLTLSEDTIKFSQKLFKEIKNKNPFRFQSKMTVIATCVFLASRLKHEPKTIEKISRVSEVKKELLELTCEMALDDLKETLLKIE